MEGIEYFTISKENVPTDMPNIPLDAKIICAQMDASIANSNIFAQGGWYTKPFFAEGLIKHDSGELLVFVGNDIENPKELGAEVEIQIGNDVIAFDKTCALFVPAGVAHGNLNIKSMASPIFNYICHVNTGTYKAEPAEATEEKGKYINNMIQDYVFPEGVDRTLEDDFKLALLWSDGIRIEGAPYMETLWFRGLRLVPAPPEHTHEFDELIGYFSSDPNNPNELSIDVCFDVEGEGIPIKESCLGYLPKGLKHSPMVVSKVDRPAFHFTLGNGANYTR